MPQMKLPEEVVIKWFYENPEKPFESTIKLQGVEAPQGQEELIFFFTSQYSWEVRSGSRK